MGTTASHRDLSTWLKPLLSAQIPARKVSSTYHQVSLATNDQSGVADRKATKIRLQIYEILLVRDETSLYIRSVEGLDGVKPSNIAVTYDKYRGEEYASINSYPSPMILSVCRTITAEATRILYRKNTFRFRSLGFHWVDFKLPKEEITNLWSNLFAYTQHHWLSDGSPLSKYSEFAAFISAIGPLNTGEFASRNFLLFPSSPKIKLQRHERLAEVVVLEAIIRDNTDGHREPDIALLHTQ